MMGSSTSKTISHFPCRPVLQSAKGRVNSFGVKRHDAFSCGTSGTMHARSCGDFERPRGAGPREKTRRAKQIHTRSTAQWYVGVWRALQARGREERKDPATAHSAVNQRALGLGPSVRDGGLARALVGARRGGFCARVRGLSVGRADTDGGLLGKPDSSSLLDSVVGLVACRGCAESLKRNVS